MAKRAPFFLLFHGVPPVEDRRVIRGIVDVIRDGFRWNDAPNAQGPDKTLSNRVGRWRRLGVCQRIVKRGQRWIGRTAGGLHFALLMDRAFEGDETRRQAQRLEYQPVVPPTSNRCSSWQYEGLLSRRRNDIDRLLRCLKRYRRVFTRYDT